MHECACTDANIYACVHKHTQRMRVIGIMIKREDFHNLLNKNTLITK